MVARQPPPLTYAYFTPSRRAWAIFRALFRRSLRHRHRHHPVVAGRRAAPVKAVSEIFRIPCYS